MKMSSQSIFWVNLVVRSDLGYRCWCDLYEMTRVHRTVNIGKASFLKLFHFRIVSPYWGNVHSGQQGAL